MIRVLLNRILSAVLLVLLPVMSLAAQECAQGAEIETITRTAIDDSVRNYITWAAQGDAAKLRGYAIPSLQASFQAIEQTISHDRGQLGSQVTIRREYLLDASSAAAIIPNAEFFCGLYGSGGHTPSSASFAIPNLAPGRYALALTNVSGGKQPYMVTVVLQQVAGRWLLAGYYPKPTEAAGHDAIWYVEQARAYKHQGQPLNAWLYYNLAWEIYAPVPFMSSLQLDKLAGEIRAAQPADVPLGSPVTLPAANGKSYSLIAEFAAPDDQGKLSLVVKYQATDLNNTAQTLQDNMAVIRAVVARAPELRQAFQSVVARATAPSGADYGTLLAISDIH